MILEVPIINQDGSIRVVMTLTPEQTHTILQFGLNFLASTGLAASYGIQVPDEGEFQPDLPFND